MTVEYLCDITSSLFVKFLKAMTNALSAEWPQTQAKGLHCLYSSNAAGAHQLPLQTPRPRLYLKRKI